MTLNNKWKSKSIIDRYFYKKKRRNVKMNSTAQDNDLRSNKDLKSILITLKGQLKAKGYTYSDLATYLGISEVTVKRILTGRSLSLKFIIAICDFLNISFLDMASLAKMQSGHEVYVLNSEQDKFFATNPRSYIIFINLYRRTPVEKVMADWNLTEKSFFSLLRIYEKLKLIDLYSNNNFKFKMSGLVRIPRGHLSKVLEKYDQQFLQYIQESSGNNKNHFFQSSEVLISPEHVEEFRAVIIKAVKDFNENAYFDETMLPQSKTQSVRLLIAFSPYESNWKQS